MPQNPKRPHRDDDDPIQVESDSDPLETATFEHARHGRTSTADGGSPPLTLTGTRYTIVGEIDRGGMGVVYRAVDEEFHRPLAVKVLLEDDGPNERRRERFLAEARITGQLQHPGVAAVHEIGRLEDGRPFFAMKLIAGRTLSDLLKERPSPTSDLPHFVKIFEQIAQTLAYAHSEGVVHRDLKPSNVMVGAFGEVQVMDWGLACRLDSSEPSPEPRSDTPARTAIAPGDEETNRFDESATPGSRLTRHGDVMGTPAYMPPEQARGEVESLDQRSDVFGLGGILCVILTGKPPYHSHKDATPLAQAVAGDLSQAKRRLAECDADRELVDLALACLSPDANDRPAHAAAVADRISVYLNSVQQRLQQAAIDQAAAEAKAVEERKRRRLSSALSASLVLFTIAGGVAMAWYFNHQAATAARVNQATGDIHASLLEASRTYGDLLKVLEDPQQAYTLMDEPRLWRRDLDTAILAIERAESLARQISGAPQLDQRITALKQQLEQAMRGHELAIQLEAIRQQSSVVTGGKWDPAIAAPAYASLLAAVELPILEGDVERLALRIKQSSVRPFIVAALDHWASTLGEGDELARLLEIARLADPDPWRDRLRSIEHWHNPDELATLADNCDVDAQSPQTLVLLAWRMRSVGTNSTAFLNRVQQRYPSDFWVNLTFADHSRKPTVQISFNRAALAIRPDSMAAWNNLGSVLFAQQEFDGAADAFRQALAIEPDFAFAQHNLGNALAAMGDLDAAFVAYSRALEIDSQYVEAQNNLGNVLQAQGKLNEAITAYRQAIEIDATHAPAHSNLGNAFAEKGDLERAIEAFDKALQLDPEDADTLNDFGSALHAQGRAAAAVDAFRRAIQVDPAMTQAHVNLGIASLDLGDTSQSIAANRRALELDAKNVDAHYGLANAFRAENRIDESIAAYQRAIDLNPEFAQAYNNLGNAFGSKGDTQAAIESFRKSISLQPTLRPPHGNLGVALATAGDLSGSIEVFRNAIEIFPTDAELYYSLGIALSSQGENEQAKAAYRKTLTLDGKHAEAHCNLAGLLREEGRFGESLDFYQRGHQLGSQRSDWSYPSTDWVAEAEQLVAVNQKLDDVLRGEDTPTNAEEQLRMAELLFQYRKRYKRATDFYAEAIEQKPTLADPLANEHRYQAASAAILAAAEAADDQAEKTRLLQRAETWLRADLTAWEQLLEREPRAAAFIAHKLQLWSGDPNLVAVRGATGKDLALTEDERVAWRELWSQVEALRTRAAKPDAAAPQE